MAQEGMFKSDDILEWVRRSPFEPFRLCMSDGRVFDVRHPELALVSRRFVMVVEHSDQTPGLVERLHDCAIIHIARLERLAEAG